MKRWALAVLLPLVASACTTTGGAPVAGWPELAIVEHHVPHREMRERCNRYAHPLMSPEACAEFYFDQGECHIWFSSDFPPSPTIVRHEHEHCLGYEHAGEAGMRDILARYLASRDVASASAGATAPSAATDARGADAPAAPLLRGESEP